MNEIFNAKEKNELNILRITTDGETFEINETLTPYLHKRVMNADDKETLIKLIVNELWPEKGLEIDEVEIMDDPTSLENNNNELAPIPSDDYFGPQVDEDEDVVILLPEEDLMMINTLKILHSNVYEALTFIHSRQGEISLADVIFGDENKIDEMIEIFVLIWNGEISAQTYESLEESL